MYEFIEVKTDNHIAKVEDMAKQIWSQHYASILNDGQVEYMLERFQSASAIKQQITEENMRYFIVRSDGAQLGYFAVKEEGESMYLSKLYVLAWARGKGVGKNCLQYIKQLCKIASKQRLYLNVNRDNESSIAAYKAFGFQQEGSQVSDIGNGFVMDDYVMSMRV